MLAIAAIVLAMALVPAIRESTDSARNATIAEYNNSRGLDCGNSSISDFDKGACIITDLTMPYWVFIVLGLAGAAVGARIVFGP